MRGSTLVFLSTAIHISLAFRSTQVRTPRSFRSNVPPDSSAESTTIDPPIDVASDGLDPGSARLTSGALNSSGSGDFEDAAEDGYFSAESSSRELTRREWLRSSALLFGGAIVSGAAYTQLAESPTQNDKTLAPVNITQIVRETTVNITVERTRSFITLNTTSFQKIETLKLPPWVPSWLLPAPKAIKDISDAELLIAAIVGGSAVEVFRTTLLYPLLTLKTRIQTQVNTRRRRRKKGLHLRRRWQITVLSARRHFMEGRLYAGIVPMILVSVPATGVFYGVRDVSKRMLNALPVSDLPLALTAAFIADVASLMVRVPGDALALRLQAATAEQPLDMDEEELEEELEEKVGNWFVESLERLPAVLITDLPYLLARIAVNRAVIQGQVDIAHYEVLAISTAILCALLTTPFDVARTRILVDSDDDPSNGIDGGSGQGLVETFRTIAAEGDGGVRNLFAGWLERTAYLGIGRACLEPLQVVGYIAIRDAILLEFFD